MWIERITNDDQTDRQRLSVRRICVFTSWQEWHMGWTSRSRVGHRILRNGMVQKHDYEDWQPVFSTLEFESYLQTNNYTITWSLSCCLLEMRHQPISTSTSTTDPSLDPTTSLPKSNLQPCPEIYRRLTILGNCTAVRSLIFDTK